MALTLYVYRAGAADADVCEYETRREYLDAERALRRITRRHRGRPIYGEPLLVLNQPPARGASYGR